MLAALRSKIDAQTALTAGTGLAVYGLSALTGPLLAEALGASGRGDLTSVQVPSQLFGYLLCFGLPQAAVYFAPSHKRKASITAAWVFALVVGGVVVAGLWWLVPSYLHGHSPLTVFWLRIMLITMVGFLPVSVTVDLLRTRPKMTAFNALTAFPIVLNTVLIVSLRISGHLDLHTALIALFASQVTWYLFVVFGWRGLPRLHLPRNVFFSEVNYGARLALGSLSEMLVARLDQFLLVAVVAPRQLGLYAVAATAAGLSGPAAWGVALVLFPRIRTAQDPREVAALTRRAMKLTALCSTGFAAIIAATSPFLLPLLFGSAFRSSVGPLLILLPGQICFDLANVVSQQVMAANKPGAVSKAYLFAAVVTVGGLALLIKPLGIQGAALVTSVSQACYLLYLLGTVRRHTKRASGDGPETELPTIDVPSSILQAGLDHVEHPHQLSPDIAAPTDGRI